jgi:hypothetical protein
MKPETIKRIVDAEWKAKAHLAGQVHQYHFAEAAVSKLTTKAYTTSGVILTLESLGGKMLVEPVIIRDGLSDELILALRRDLYRSYELATLLKPRQP